MTTKRNNMFHNRGFACGITLALKAIEEYGNLEKVKECLLKYKDARCMTDNAPGFSRSLIESASIVTNYYFVTVKDDQYVKTVKILSGRMFSEWVYWSESTSTQCIVTVYGDSDAANFVDDDLNFQDNIAKLIGIADDWEIIERPKVIELTDNWRYDYFN